MLPGSFPRSGARGWGAAPRPEAMGARPCLCPCLLSRAIPHLSSQPILKNVIKFNLFFFPENTVLAGARQFVDRALKCLKCNQGPAGRLCLSLCQRVGAGRELPAGVRGWLLTWRGSCRGAQRSPPRTARPAAALPYIYGAEKPIKPRFVALTQSEVRAPKTQLFFWGNAVGSKCPGRTRRSDDRR